MEVSLASLIAHSTARLLEFFYENDSPVVRSLTEDEKMSLELWAKVGGDGQVGNFVRKNAINCHVLVHVCVCVRVVVGFCAFTVYRSLSVSVSVSASKDMDLNTDIGHGQRHGSQIKNVTWSF